MKQEQTEEQKMAIIGKRDAISNSFKMLFKCLYFHFCKASQILLLPQLEVV